MACKECGGDCDEHFRDKLVTTIQCAVHREEAAIKLEFQNDKDALLGWIVLDVKQGQELVAQISEALMVAQIPQDQRRDAQDSLMAAARAIVNPASKAN